MKVRQCYVSNSSSSSFIVVGYRISNPLKAIKEGKCVMVYVEAGGNSGECEDWSMFLTKDTYDILQKSQWLKKINPIYIEVDMSAKCQYDNDIGKHRRHRRHERYGHRERRRFLCPEHGQLHRLEHGQEGLQHVHDVTESEVSVQPGQGLIG